MSCSCKKLDSLYIQRWVQCLRKIQLHVKSSSKWKFELLLRSQSRVNKSSWDILEFVFQLASCVHNYIHTATIFPLPIVMTRRNQHIWECLRKILEPTANKTNDSKSWVDSHSQVQHFKQSANSLIEHTQRPPMRKWGPQRRATSWTNAACYSPSQPMCYLHVKCLSSSQTTKSKSDDNFTSWWLWWKFLLIANMTIPIQQASSCGKVCGPVVSTPNSRQ